MYWYFKKENNVHNLFKQNLSLSVLKNNKLCCSIILMKCALD